MPACAITKCFRDEVTKGTSINKVASKGREGVAKVVLVRFSRLSWVNNGEEG